MLGRVYRSLVLWASLIVTIFFISTKFSGVYYDRTPFRNTKYEALSKYQTNNEYYPTDELTRTRNEVINHITTKPTKPRYTIKTIVAYSLAKLINSHNKLIECTGFQDVVHEQAKNNEWNKIGNVYVYSVYLDTRLDPHRYVRIISLIKVTNTTKKLYCHFTYNDTFKTVEAIYTRSWYEAWNNKSLIPILISCKIPDDYRPHHVSLSAEPCTLNRTRYKLTDVKKTKTQITICVKPLNYKQDISEKLMGWIEINKILGADSFNIFTSKIHKNIKKLLNFYANQGYLQHLQAKYIDTTRLNLWSKRKYEVIFYMDCFYRNLHSDYILPIDIDEVIVPRKLSNWKELLEKAGNYTSYTVSNTYYVLPKNSTRIPYFSHKHRGNYSKNGRSEKSFLNTANALTLYHHNIIKTLHRNYRFLYRFRPDEAQMNHYKSNCNELILIDCKTLFKNEFYDDIIGKYEEQFNKSISTVRKQFDLYTV